MNKGNTSRVVKGLMIVMLVAFVALIATVICSTQGIVVLAEEPVPIVDEGISMAIWFEENALPYVMTFATTLSGLLVVLAPFVATLSKLRKGNKRMVELNSSVVADNILLKADNKKLIKKLNKTCKTVDALYEMTKIAYLNNIDLVVNGHAMKIADVCKCVDECKEDEEDMSDVKEREEGQEADVAKGKG